MNMLKMFSSQISQCMPIFQVLPSMAMLHSSEWWWNDSERSANVMLNSSLGPEVEDGVRNYYAMLYSLLILAIVFGNVLVCLAVVREKSLQTTTNYLVVSLAVADLLVASLVMPWVVYLEVRTKSPESNLLHTIAILTLIKWLPKVSE